MRPEQRKGSSALRRWGAASAALVAAGVGTLVAEVLWVAFRDLPSFEGHDISGFVGGRLADVRPIRLVVLGDSTSTGPGLAGPADVWLHQALEGMQLDRPVEIVSLAVGGSRIADVRRRLPEVAPLAPDVVVVAAGSNDAIHGTRHRRFAHDLEATVDELSRLAVVGVCNVGDLGNLARVPAPLSGLLHRRSQAIRSAIGEVVDRHDRAVLIDVSASDDGFRHHGVFSADLFHPNAAGHALWAAAARPGLADALSEVRADEPSGTVRHGRDVAFVRRDR